MTTLELGKLKFLCKNKKPLKSGTKSHPFCVFQVSISKLSYLKSTTSNLSKTNIYPKQLILARVLFSEGLGPDLFFKVCLEIQPKIRVQKEELLILVLHHTERILSSVINRSLITTYVVHRNQKMKASRSLMTLGKPPPVDEPILNQPLKKVLDHISEAVARRCSVKMVFLKILQNSLLQTTSLYALPPTITCTHTNSLQDNFKTPSLP